jgi:TonB family protein
MDFFFDQDRQEWTTLGPAQPAKRRRWSFSLVVSTGIHALILLALCWPAIPIFVKPNWVARGEGGNATPVSIALYIPKDIQQAAQTQKPLLALPASAQKKPAKTKLQKRSNVLEVEKPTTTTEAGSQSGSAYDGPMSGDEVKPALPITFQDLKIGRSELPGGAPGDVIVEITIDAQGNVIEEKLLQGLGQNVDERVIAALRDWRFHPATRNGMAIPSKHDVHFHFPS